MIIMGLVFYLNFFLVFSSLPGPAAYVWNILAEMLVGQSRPSAMTVTGSVLAFPRSSNECSAISANEPLTGIAKTALEAANSANSATTLAG